MSFFFVINGLDGAGKSTQIEYIKSKFITEMHPFVFFRTRIGWTKRIHEFKKHLSTKTNQNTTSKTHPSNRKKIVRHMHRALATFDFILVLCEIRFALLLGKIVITDRYVEDNRIIDQDKSGQHKKMYLFLWEVISFIAKEPTATFHLSISAAESFNRIMKKSGNIMEQTLEVLENRVQMYHNNREYKNWHVLDATLSTKELQNIIWREISTFLS